MFDDDGGVCVCVFAHTVEQGSEIRSRVETHSNVRCELTLASAK